VESQRSADGTGGKRSREVAAPKGRRNSTFVEAGLGAIPSPLPGRRCRAHFSTSYASAFGLRFTRGYNPPLLPERRTEHHKLWVKASRTGRAKRL